VQRLQVARHPNRPTFLDIVLNISDKFVELHGDRAGLDDPAMVCGLASIDGVSFMCIGHQKGRNTKVHTIPPAASRIYPPIFPLLQASECIMVCWEL
jgi:acetyl-CoA carboxylase alpha subunit